ncbi:transcriptional regulator [Opitutaceae bacterium TAV1]|nr:transcriptional regulator [Opitutaceae bacterium TAV1]
MSANFPSSSPVATSPSPRVTIADIAAHLDVSKATVSVALRGKPGVSAEEGERIRKAAEKLGYRPDPLVGIHMAQVRNARAPHYRATLAWIDNHPAPLEPGTHPEFYEGRQGAFDEASRLGFRLEEFRPVTRGMTSEVLTRVLRTRNIIGLILAPQPHSGGTMDLDWQHFSAVTLGYSLRSPRLHLVSNCQRNTLQGALIRLRSFGYRRVGTVINEEVNERVNRAWTCAFWDDYHAQPVRRRLMPLLFHPERRPLTAKLFAGWFDEKKPDAVIAEDSLAPVLEGLRVLNLQPGRDVALAVRGAVTGDTTFAGMNQNHRAVGAAAVACVAGMLQRGERGIPAMPQQLLIESTWQSGTSVDERYPCSSPRR